MERSRVHAKWASSGIVPTTDGLKVEFVNVFSIIYARMHVEKSASTCHGKELVTVCLYSSWHVRPNAHRT